MPPSTVTHWPPDCLPERSPIYTWNELTLSISPELAWSWLIRAPLWPNWYSNSKRVVLENAAGPDLAVGTWFSWTTFGVRVRTVVEEFVPYERLAWRGKGLGAAGYHAWYLEPRPQGCHVITEETQHGLIPSLGRWVLRPGLLHYHQKWLEGLERMGQTGFPPDK